jgi:hypothetical protein
MSSASFKQDVVVAGRDDWVHAAQVAWFAESRYADLAGAARIKAAMMAIRELLADDQIEIGDLTDAGFQAWDGTPNDQADRMEAAWMALGHSPEPGDLCWLANTSRGDRAAAEADENRGVDD